MLSNGGEGETGPDRATPNIIIIIIIITIYDVEKDLVVLLSYL